MLKFGLNIELDKLVHINDVANGIRCGCVCPHCKDGLNAKNQGKYKQPHFAHTTKLEGRACLMTQLHRAAQEHLSRLQCFQVPLLEIAYNGANLKIEGSNQSVKSSFIEFKVDKYIADVVLNTSSEKIHIEIFVSHKCDRQKIDYFRKNDLDLIEYDLSHELNNEIEDVLDRLEKNKLPFKWLSSSRKNLLINNHLQELERRAQQKNTLNQKELQLAINKLTDSMIAVLPCMKFEEAFEMDGKVYIRNKIVVPKKKYIFDSIIPYIEADNAFLCTVKDRIKEEHKLIIVFLFSDNLHIPNVESEYSVVKFIFDLENKKWNKEWHQMPFLKKLMESHNRNHTN